MAAQIRLDPAVLDAARRIDGLTSDEQLGAALGKTGHTVRSWRSGVTAPNIAALMRLKQITGWPLDRMVVHADSARQSACPHLPGWGPPDNRSRKDRDVRT